MWPCDFNPIQFSLLITSIMFVYALLRAYVYFRGPETLLDFSNPESSLSHPDLICSLEEEIQEARKAYHPHLIFILKQLDEDWWIRKLAACLEPLPAWQADPHTVPGDYSPGLGPPRALQFGALSS